MSSLSRLALGTVQFGIPYGISNSNGQVSLEDASSILQLGLDKGISTLDTAIAYGNSESVLGKIGVEQWQIISKIPSLPSDVQCVKEWAYEQIHSSLFHLRVNQIHGLLLHNPSDLHGIHGQELYETLLTFKEDNLVKKIGYSIYAPAELDELTSSFPPDIVQAPFNIFDRRLTESGWLGRLAQMGCEIHVRSIFLQGLLLMDQYSRPKKFSRWSALWDQWDSWRLQNNLTALGACLQFVLSYPEISKIVIGVTSIAELKQIIEVTTVHNEFVPFELHQTEPVLINPGQWKTL